MKLLLGFSWFLMLCLHAASDFNDSRSSLTSSSSSKSSRSGLEENNVLPEHRFHFEHKTYQSGKNKGKRHTTVSLIVAPYEFKKRMVRKDFVYFSCNGKYFLSFLAFSHL